jgi:hypothetical protein
MNRLAKLLQRPLGCRVICDINVDYPSGTHLHDDEDIQHPEGCRHGHEKVAGDNGLRRISDEGYPPL